MRLSDEGYIMLFLICLMVGLGYTVVLLSSASCSARWEGTRKVQWGMLSGCLVATEADGGVKYVPEDRIWYERNQ